MKKELTSEQTAKLVSHGFADGVLTERHKWIPEGIARNFSLGDLLEMLPPRIGEWDLSIWHDFKFQRWVICFEPETQTSAATELIDAVYNLILKLNNGDNR